MMTIHRILVAIGGPAAFALALWAPVCPAHAQANSVHIDVEGMFTTYLDDAVGIGSEHEVIEHKVIDQFGNEIIRKIPGRLKYLDITLKRGITSNLDLADWRKLVEDGPIEDARKNMTATLVDPLLRPIAVWSGTNCWPSRIENLLPDPASDTDEAVEKLVIVCEGLERIRP